MVRTPAMVYVKRALSRSYESFRLNVVNNLSAYFQTTFGKIRMQTGQKESRMEFDRPDDRIPPKYVTPSPKFVQDLN